MPKERFFHLPEEKRKRIYQAAYEELSRVPYDELSINQIIRRAGIPRGSFYQYFQDKEDLLAYLMEGFQGCFMEAVRKTIRDSGGDIFYVYLEVLTQMIAFAEQGDHYRMLKNVFCGLKVAEVKSFEVFRNISGEFIREVYETVDLDRFKSRRMEDFMELIEFLSILTRNAAAEIFSDMTRKEAVLEEVRLRLEIIKYGVLEKEEQKANVEV